MADLCQARPGGDAPAFYTAAQTWTHSQVHEGAKSAAAVMALAVAPGDRVLIVAPDSIELVWAFLAVARLGGISVLVNPMLTVSDHEFMVADCQPSLVVCEPLLAERFGHLAAVLTTESLAAAVGDEGSADGPSLDVAVNPDTPAYAQYTSGTTGRPKAALHRHSDPPGFHAAMGEGVLGLRPGDVVLSVSKSYFAYGLGNSIFFPLLSGCAAVLEPTKATVDRVAAAVSRYGATVLFAVPSFYARMVAEGDAAQFASLRIAVSAGEALPPAMYQRVSAWLGCEVLDGLGSTEVGQTFISNGIGRSRPGSIGTILTGYKASIRDDEGRATAAGQQGCLWVRGATVMLGYLNRPAETAAVLVDGWCCTGDRVSVDADGYYHHHGRLDDMEMVGGINVSPLEVEAVLLQHPSIAEVAVAAVPDTVGATRLRCFAVPDPRSTWSEATERQILDLARAHLAAFKVPRSVTPVTSLPRTPTGKLRRHILRQGWPPAEGSDLVL
ncbi:MAG TPA: AMP-binding protein [Acidimicrobiales bacterium]|nr:AMP-binding protein [Acidimicrobiales bacterium]